MLRSQNEEPGSVVRGKQNKRGRHEVDLAYQFTKMSHLVLTKLHNDLGRNKTRGINAHHVEGRTVGV